MGMEVDEARGDDFSRGVDDVVGLGLGADPGDSPGSNVSIRGVWTSDRLRTRIVELLSESVFSTPTLLLHQDLLFQVRTPFAQEQMRPFPACIVISGIAHKVKGFKRRAKSHLPLWSG